MGRQSPYFTFLFPSSASNGNRAFAFFFFFSSSLSPPRRGEHCHGFRYCLFGKTINKISFFSLWQQLF